MKTSVHLNGTDLWVCDMRPGISQDGIKVKIPAGDYRCETSRSEATGLVTITYVQRNDAPTSERLIGEFSIDMARVGVIELKPLLAKHEDDWGKLADWSDESADKNEKEWGGRLRSGSNHAMFFSIGGDCTVEVYGLSVGRRDIGLVIRPKQPPTKPAKPCRWTWVYVKLRGIGDAWKFCDDWDFAPDDEFIFDDIDRELSYFTDAEIDHSEPLSKYYPKLRGVPKITAFIQDDANPYKSITRSIQMPKLKVSPTAKQLAAAVLNVFEQARKTAQPVAGAKPAVTPPTGHEARRPAS